MLKANNKKICIVVSSLGKGGAERSSGLLSQILFDVGYDVHVVSVLNDIEFSYKGKLLNLGELKDQDDSVLGRLKRLRVLKAYLKKHNFDYVIDNRTRIGFLKEFVISKFIYSPKKTIYCIRSYKTANYINPNRFLGRLLYANAYKIVGVSKAIAEHVKAVCKFKNVTSIYNPIVLEKYNSKLESKDNYILFFGRLDDEVKNISLLLAAYSKSELPKHNVSLKILGEGKDLETLKNQVETLNIASNVEFLPYNPYPSAIVKSALFTVLTSRYEGFPRSILESLALGTPVVSVDCKSGPNEIIQSTFNGLLVENHNQVALAEAMTSLFIDKDLYLHCKQNSKPSVAHFSEAEIVQQWQSILN
ncbi:Alpha-1,4-N-acetylgalactosamine transferase PglH [Winogradskyella psychrotolerans RS-3]|uniref:Alpha-1,4-N-acetylgalactosamine transferase PglH n=1 Tax=Winogradskyella psychrotolerans RS-3 TaxID=641526 RepID=S7VV06_9FLAO|nr:glycosyltransferase [Winogradskyella psychrotolerans]EPR73901.1 Alpha-1,4-N-acetylgalactosamine transferase PglH [Winogradskyella psychrotolerans RS-3]